jgi:hypothetical protein
VTDDVLPSKKASGECQDAEGENDGESEGSHHWTGFSSDCAPQSRQSQELPTS